MLLNSECLVKVADFGLARSIEFKEKETARHPVLTDYVATRCVAPTSHLLFSAYGAFSLSWYRAPEILLGSTDYTKGVDLWSVGCILGELLGGKPMFPGTSTMNQLDRIIEITGRPSAEDIEAINSPFAATMLESLPETQPRSLASMFPNAPEDALDILSKLLQFNPNKRITADVRITFVYCGYFSLSSLFLSFSKRLSTPTSSSSITPRRRLPVSTPSKFPSATTRSSPLYDID